VSFVRFRARFSGYFKSRAELMDYQGKNEAQVFCGMGRSWIP
jgi:hypothetical protein